MARSASISIDTRGSDALLSLRTVQRIHDRLLTHDEILSIARDRSPQSSAFKVHLAATILTLPNSSQNIVAATDALARQGDRNVQITLLEAGYRIFRGKGYQILSIENIILSGRPNSVLFNMVAENTENEATMRKIVDLHTKKPEVISHMFTVNEALSGNGDLREKIRDYALRKNIPAVSKAISGLSGGVSRIFRR